jgi:hypothetical protein
MSWRVYTVVLRNVLGWHNVMACLYGSIAKRVRMAENSVPLTYLTKYK